jgi:O-antigen/teichoic acid export membrane protein
VLVALSNLGALMDALSVTFDLLLAMAMGALCVLAVALLPIIVAYKRKHRATGGIAALTIIGFVAWPVWFIALMLSLLD